MKNPVVLCLRVYLCLVSVLHGDTRWTGAKSNLWSDPANWSNGFAQC